MSATILLPQHSLLAHLQDELREAEVCLATVAYLDAAVGDQLAAALHQRMADGRPLAFRILVRTRDYFTSPHALRTLLALTPRDGATIELRWSTHDKFHAKAFGFRTTPAAPPRVLIGSANLLSRAVGTDSGELGVWVDGGDAAAEAWNALEAFWSEGDRITPAWLGAYEKQHAAIAARRAAVDALIARVPKPRRRSDLERPTAVPDALYVKVGSWMSEGRAAELDEAAEAQGVELPEECYESTEAEARRLREVSPFLDLTFDGARLNLVSLISTGEPFPFRETRRSAPVWLVPWKVVRGSTLAFRDRDFPRIATIFDKHRLGGWLQNPTEGFLGARRTRLLQCLADLGWKPAKEPTTKSKEAPRVR